MSDNPDLLELRRYNHEAIRRECQHLNVRRGYCFDCKSGLSLYEQLQGIWNRGGDAFPEASEP